MRGSIFSSTGRPRGALRDVGRRASTKASVASALVCALATFGCGASSTGAAAPPDDAGQGLPPPETGGAVMGTNPYGVPYPTNNIGFDARKGSIPGNQIQNYKFLGYPGGDVSKGIQTISLADFYDPEGKLGYKLLHLGVAAVWCTPCNEETQATVPLIPGFLEQGVVFAQALDDGATMGTGATPADLMSWINKYHSNFTEMLDPGNMNLGMFFNAAAVPWNAIIDARSMEILTANVGYSGDLQGDVSPWLTWVANNPPSYPAP